MIIDKYCHVDSTTDNFPTIADITEHLYTLVFVIDLLITIHFKYCLFSLSLIRVKVIVD